MWRNIRGALLFQYPIQPRRLLGSSANFTEGMWAIVVDSGQAFCTPPLQIFFSSPVSPDLSHLWAPGSNLAWSLMVFSCISQSVIWSLSLHLLFWPVCIGFYLTWIQTDDPMLLQWSKKQNKTKQKNTLHLSFKDICLLVQLSSISQGELLVKNDFFLWIYCVCTSKMLSSWFNLWMTSNPQLMCFVSREHHWHGPLSNRPEGRLDPRTSPLPPSPPGSPLPGKTSWKWCWLWKRHHVFIPTVQWPSVMDLLYLSQVILNSLSCRLDHLSTEPGVSVRRGCWSQELATHPRDGPRTADATSVACPT